MRFVSCAAILLVGLGLSACKTIAPNTLSAADTANLRFTSVEVRAPETAKVRWSSAEDDYLKGRGLSMTDPALTKTPEARAHVHGQAAERLKAALERVVAGRIGGTREARVVATIEYVDIPSVAQRVVIGGSPSLKAELDVVDARSGAVLTRYSGALGSGIAPAGVTGVLVDSVMVAAGRDDLFDRAANDYAAGFKSWLNAGQPSPVSYTAARAE